MTIAEIDRIPMIFIVGVGRSGTTLLRTIMDASPEAVFPPESKLIIHLKKKYLRKTNWTADLVDEFLTDLFKESKFAIGWKISKDDLREHILSYNLSQLHFSALIKIIYLFYSPELDKRKIRVIGDKNPIYSLFVEELKEVFPNAKFIHLVRDYRDNILSRRKIFFKQSIAGLSIDWRLYNMLIEKAKSQYPENFYTIRYVDLVENPEKKVEKIFKYSRLKYDKKVLRYYENLEDEIDEEYLSIIKDIHGNLFNEINTDSVGKWKDELTHKELDIITYILGDFGKIYNYEPYQEYSGKKYRWLFLKSSILSFKDITLIKGYFLLPFSIRDKMSQLSKLLFTRFGYYNVYNGGDFIVEIRNDSEGNK